MDWIKKHKYLYFPVILLLVYMGLDKIFTSETYKSLTMDDAPFIIFEYKEQLLDELEQVDRKRRVANQKFAASNPGPRSGKVPGHTLLMLGSSRLLYFDHQMFSRNYPDWELFNFSGPVTFPIYYLYILERALQRGVKPDLIVMETAPFQYSDGTDAFQRSNLAFSFDLPFVIDHFQLFTRDEVSYYLALRMFAGYHYPPSWNNLKMRWGNPDHKFRIMFDSLAKFQKANRGAAINLIPRMNYFERDFATLDYQARVKTIRWLYKNYSISERQFDATTQILQLLREHKIPVVMVRPAVTSILRNTLEQNEHLKVPLATWQSRVEQMRDDYKTIWIDFDRRPDYKCNTFVDAAHMSTDCYDRMISIIMQEYWQAN